MIYCKKFELLSDIIHLFIDSFKKMSIILWFVLIFIKCLLNAAL
jgi:hypothetical protein